MMPISCDNLLYIIASVLGIVSLSIILTENLWRNFPFFFSAIFFGVFSLTIFIVQILDYFDKHFTIKCKCENRAQQSLESGSGKQ